LRGTTWDDEIEAERAVAEAAAGARVWDHEDVWAREDCGLEIVVAAC